MPETVTLRGTVRTLRPETRAMIREQMVARTDLICRAFGAQAHFTWHERYPSTINTAAEAEIARLSAADTTPANGVLTDLAPSMASEDFSYMLEEKPGAYSWLGCGSAENGKNLHSARYDFNDEISRDRR